MINLNKNENATLIVEFSNNTSPLTISTQVINVTQGVVSQGSFLMTTTREEIVVWTWDGQKISKLENYSAEIFEEGEIVSKFTSSNDFYLRVVDIHRMDFVSEIPLAQSTKLSDLNIYDQIQENYLDQNDYSNKTFTLFLESDLNDNSKQLPYQSTLTFELNKNLVNKYSVQMLGLVIPTSNNKICGKKYPVFTHFERNQNINGEQRELKMHFNDRYLNNMSGYGFNVTKIVVNKNENINKLVTKEEFTNNEILINLNNNNLLNKKILLKASVEHVTNNPTNEYGQGTYVTTNYFTLDLRNASNQTYIPLITKVENEDTQNITISLNQEILTITKEIINHESVDINLKEITFLDLEVMNVLENDNVKSIIGINNNLTEYKTLLQQTICFDLENREAYSPKLNFTSTSLINSYPVYECKPLLKNDILQTGYIKYTDTNNVTFQYKEYERTITLIRGDHSSLSNNVISNDFVTNQVNNTFGWNKINFISTLPGDELELTWEVSNFNCDQTPNKEYNHWIHFFGIEQLKLPLEQEIKTSNAVVQKQFAQFITQHVFKDPNNTLVTSNDLGNYITLHNDSMFLSMGVVNGPVSFPLSVKIKSNQTLEMRGGRNAYQDFTDNLIFEFTDNQKTHQGQIVNTTNATLSKDMVRFDLNNGQKLSPDLNFDTSNLVNTYPIYLCKPLHDNETILPTFNKYTDTNNVTFQYKEYERTITLIRGDHSSLSNNVISNDFVTNQVNNTFGWNKINFISTLPGDELELTWEVSNFNCDQTPNKEYNHWIHFFGIEQLKLPLEQEIKASNAMVQKQFAQFITQHVFKDPNNTQVTSNDLGNYITLHNDEMFLSMGVVNGPVIFPLSVKMKSNQTLEMRGGRNAYQDFTDNLIFEFTDNSKEHPLQYLNLTNHNDNNIETNESILGNVIKQYKTLQQETICFNLENRIAMSPDLNFHNGTLVTTYPIFKCLPLEYNQKEQIGYTKYIDRKGVNFQFQRFERKFTLNLEDNTHIDNTNFIRFVFNINRGNEDYCGIKLTFNSTLPDDYFECHNMISQMDNKDNNPKFSEWMHAIGIEQVWLPKLSEVIGNNRAKQALISSMITEITMGDNSTHISSSWGFGNWYKPTDNWFYFSLNGANSDVSFPLKIQMSNNKTFEIRTGRHGDQSFVGNYYWMFKNNQSNHRKQIMSSNIKTTDINSTFEIKKRKVIVFKSRIYLDVYEDTNCQEKSILKLIPFKEYFATKITDNLWQIHSKNEQEAKFVYTKLDLCSLNYIVVIRKDSEINHFTNMGQVFFTSNKGNENNHDIKQYFENSGITIYANEDIDVYANCYAQTMKANFKLEQDKKYLATYTDVGTLHVCKIEGNKMQTGYIKYEDKFKYIVEAN